MSLELFGFIVLSAGLLATASFVVIARNPLHSALALILSFFCLAGLYVTLHAGFVAVLQILVYAGAILVLFLFVIMLLNLQDHELGESRWNLHKMLGVLAVVGLVVGLVSSIVSADRRWLSEPAIARSNALDKLGKLRNSYAFASELTADEFGTELVRLRAMSFAKIGLASGTEAVRTQACMLVARQDERIDPTGCTDATVRQTALALATEACVRFDEKLLALQAMADDSAAPAEWLGKNARVRPSGELSRDEKGVVFAAELIVARRLDELSAQVAKNVLSEAQQAALFAAPPQEEGTASQALQRKPLPPYGARMREATERADKLLAQAGTGESKLVSGFTEARKGLEDELARAGEQIVTALRAGKRDLAFGTLAKLRNRLSPSLDEAERERIADAMAYLRSAPGGRRAFLAEDAIPADDEFGSVAAVGRSLFTTFLLPFEVVSVLLLAAIVGAVVLAKRRKR